MDLYNTIQSLSKNHELKDKVLKITCVDGQVLHGYFDGYVSALDNEPEIPEIDIRDVRTEGLIGILETEIQSIVVESL